MKGLWQMFSRFGRSTVRVAKMEHVFEPEDRKLSCLFRFDSESAIGAFRLHTDADMGGKSSARFYFDSEKKCAVLEGNLDLTTPPGVSNSGFAAIVSREDSTGPWHLEDFDALMVRARTDGRIYVANVKCPSVIEEDLWQSFMVGESGKMSDICLPFSKFVATHRGFVEGQTGMDTRKVESIGVLMAQRRAGPFRIEIDSIFAINTDLYEFPNRRWTGVTRDSRDS